MAPVPMPPAFAFIFHPDVQEEAEDLTVHKRRPTQDPSPETTVPRSPDSLIVPPEEQTSLTLQQVSPAIHDVTASSPTLLYSGNDERTALASDLCVGIIWKR